MTQEVIRYCTEHLIKTGQVKFPNFRKKPKGRSLNPSPSVRLYADILEGWRIFNLKRKINKLPTVSLKYYCYLYNIDLSGRSLIKNKYL